MVCERRMVLGRVSMGVDVKWGSCTKAVAMTIMIDEKIAIGE